jgi:4a-hydroxytetrahydrobiopterin dehydratase
MSADLLMKMHCVPCSGGQRPLPPSEAATRLRQLQGWTFSAGKKTIQQSLKMKDFVSAVSLINRITTVAQREDHHPDLHLTGYRNLRIELSTHSIGGLSLNDFILAAKIDALPKKLKK